MTINSQDITEFWNTTETNLSNCVNFVSSSIVYSFLNMNNNRIINAARGTISPDSNEAITLNQITNLVPRGTIILFNLSLSDGKIPHGWALCNGQTPDGCPMNLPTKDYTQKHPSDTIVYICKYL